MADPRRVHPLASHAATVTPSDAVCVAALPPATRLSLRTADAAAAGAALGFTLGTPICRAEAAGPRAALKLGPDEWLLLAPDGEAAALMGVAVAGSLVDVSHRSTAIEISGPFAVEALAAFVALDLDAAAFPVGMCSRTVFGKAEIVLWRTAAEVFRIEVWRSFAPYVWECLDESCREYW